MNGEELNTKSSFALLVVTSQTFSKEHKAQVLSKVNSSKQHNKNSRSHGVFDFFYSKGLCQIDDSALLVNLAEELDYVIQANAFEPHNFGLF